MGQLGGKADMRRRRHITGLSEVSSRSSYRPDVTGDAQLRYERLSASPSSTTWYDITASANNGTASDAAIFSDFGFDGVADHVTAGAANICADMSETFTVTFWYKRNTTGVTGYSTIMQTRATGGWLLRDRSPGSVADFTWETGSSGVTNVFGTVIPGDDSNWHFGSVVWEGAAAADPKTITGYNNGTAYAAHTKTFGNDDGVAIKIGRGNSFFFYGNIDTVRVYPRALSADEIARDYYAGKPTHA